MEKIQEVKKEVRRRRRVKMILHRPAIAVRGLWEAASEEERVRAHQWGSAILQYWVGQASKEEVSKRLDVTPLRVWQMSQQALSGMVAGLLKQPRKRKGVSAMNPEEDPKILRKRIEKLERQLKIATDLVNLLREMPANREEKEKAPQSPGRKKKKEISKPDPKGSGTLDAGTNSVG